MCPLFLDYKFALSQCGQQNHYASFFAKLKGTEVRNLLDNSTIVLLEAYFNELLLIETNMEAILTVMNST